jgi:hypothetical protein
VSQVREPDRHAKQKDDEEIGMPRFECTHAASHFPKADGLRPEKIFMASCDIYTLSAEG